MSDSKAVGEAAAPPGVQLPQTSPIVAPGALKPSPEAIAAIILAKNHSIFKLGLTVYPLGLKGGAIHKISDDEALQIAKLILAQDIEPAYLMACMGIESLFDPLCENGNFLGSNPNKAREGYDVGIGQLKLKYLMADLKTGVEEAEKFATSIDKAIPYVATTMKNLLRYVDTLDTSVAIPALQNRFFLATCTYNFGRTGILNIIKTATKPPNHGLVVAKMEQTFAAALNLKSVFDGSAL